jgi:predicted Ser/Thr protein kinase
MDLIDQALAHLDQRIGIQDRRGPIPIDRFFRLLADDPAGLIRNVFQVFHDMVMAYVQGGAETYPEDPEAIGFLNYDCAPLFVEGADHPFFADRLFANRLINHVAALRRGAQQNKVYIFDGPPGCGKSTFLNNLLNKFEIYANTDAGMRYETVWRLDRRTLPGAAEGVDPISGDGDPLSGNGPTVDIPCPSHDHPLLIIPKAHRRAFLDELITDRDFKERLFNDKEYDWVFRARACTICSALYDSLMGRLANIQALFQMLYARPYRFNRRLGEGISVFNPGDRPVKQQVLTDETLQKGIDRILGACDKVHYLYSRYAKTNDGIYALMDIKSHNVERLIELHNIISEGVHKVEDIEENVTSLFIALMNPEDKKDIQNIPSFSDRITYIHIPYVLDLNTEVQIYRNIFGRQIDEHFLPRTLHNFARAVIATRLTPQSAAMAEWITVPGRYTRFCDKHLLLLKMEIYTGHIPEWLEAEDRKNLTPKRRRRIIAESADEGRGGFSGRDSIKIFNEFYSTYAREDRLINMNTLHTFFTRVRKDLGEQLPPGLLASLMGMYNYTVLQEIKESIYNYNEQQIRRDVLNYMFAVNFEAGTQVVCGFTGDRLLVNEPLLQGIENHLLGKDASEDQRRYFRREVQKEYTRRTLPQEIQVAGRPAAETELFASLRERYVGHLKEKALDPFLDNENFRLAIKAYGSDEFRSFDDRIRTDVTFLMNNLTTRFRYDHRGAKEVCIYVIDQDLARHFAR